LGHDSLPQHMSPLVGTFEPSTDVRDTAAFGGKPEKHTLILSFSGSYLSGQLEAFTRLAYRP